MLSETSAGPGRLRIEHFGAQVGEAVEQFGD